MKSPPLIKEAEERLSQNLYQEFQPEEEQISQALIPYLAHKRIVVTVGATREKIDPVRFLTNRSSGKMGFALARTALDNGAQVHIISTIENHEPWIARTQFTKVETHDDMHRALMTEFIKTPTQAPDALIMVAAVSDFKPKASTDHKIKKENLREEKSPIDSIVNMINTANEKIGSFTLELEKTTDILAELGRIKRPNQVLVGFSVETENALEHARNKIQNKNLDFVVINTTDAFGADEATVNILSSETNSEIIPLFTSVPRSSKQEIAYKILELLGLCLDAREKLNYENI